jgi:ABC-type transporter Mla subunit MlaD
VPDFESTATAAVTKLQEIDEIVTASTKKFDDFERHVEEKNSEIMTCSEDIMSTIDQLLQRLGQAKTARTAFGEQFEQKVEAVSTSLEAKKPNVEKQLQDSGALIEKLSTAVNEHEKTCGEQLQTAMTAMTGVKGDFEKVKSGLTESFDTIHAQAESMHTSSESVRQSTEDAGDRVVRFMEEDIPSKVDDEMEKVKQKVNSVKEEVETNLQEASSKVEDSVNDSVDKLKQDQDDQLESLKSAMEQMAEQLKNALSGITSAGEAMATSKDVMNTAMKSTNVGVESVIGTLKEIREIFEKIV